ncbi:MAG: AAA family ATPase [Chromatiaceae bacterium]
MLIDRTLESFIESAGHQFPVLLLTGARQVGKTTLLRKMAGPERRYVTLDDPLALELAQSDPALFLQRFPPPVLIDEIQYAPGLLPQIKLRVDARREAGLFWLTGSQQFHLMRGVSESLAGRVAVVQLLGLSRAERCQHNLHAAPFLPTESEIDERLRGADPLDLHSLYRIIWRGAMPEIALNPAMDRDLFYGSNVQTYLQRDVRDLARVGDEAAFVLEVSENTSHSRTAAPLRYGLSRSSASSGLSASHRRRRGSRASRRERPSRSLGTRKDRPQRIAAHPVALAKRCRSRGGAAEDRPAARPTPLQAHAVAPAHPTNPAPAQPLDLTEEFMATADPILAQYRAKLDEIYDGRIERVVLYGSRARGDAGTDSDYDVAVFLKDLRNRWAEIDRLAEVGTDILFATGMVINALPFRANAYLERTPLMSEIRREGLDV